MKIGGGKEGKYLEKVKYIFSEGRKTEKEEEENIWIGMTDKTNKERLSYPANGPWNAEMSKMCKCNQNDLATT